MDNRFKGKKMTEKDLVEELSDRLGFTKKATKEFMVGFKEIIMEVLADTDIDKIELYGFLTFDKYVVNTVRYDIYRRKYTEPKDFHCVSCKLSSRLKDKVRKARRENFHIEKEFDDKRARNRELEQRQRELKELSSEQNTGTMKNIYDDDRELFDTSEEFDYNFSEYEVDDEE